MVDHVRSGKRLVHPHLPPPIGYAANYEYDETKMRAKFIVQEPAISGRGKRRRAESSSESDSDDSEEDSDFECTGKMEKPVPRLLNRRLSLPVNSRASLSISARDRLFRRSSTGGRASARIANADGLLTRQKIFAALKDAMSEEDSSDLSDSDESEEDFRSGRKILAGLEEMERDGRDQDEVVNASLDNTSSLSPSPLSTPFLPDTKPILSPPASSPPPPSRRILPTPSTVSPPSSTAAVDAPDGSASSSQSNRNRRSSRNNVDDSSSLSAPSGSSTGSSSNVPMKEGGGDAAGDEDGNEKRKIVVAVLDMDVEEEVKEEEDEDTCLKDRNEDEREAVALMLLLGRSVKSSTASPKPASLTTPARNASRESSLSSVGATPEHQPIPSTSAARSSFGTEDDDSAKKRRGRPTGALQRLSFPPTSIPRPVRSVRNKKKDEFPPVPPPRASSSTVATARTSCNIANGTEQRKRGRPPGPLAQTPPTILTRPTRATNPIADPMKDFLQSTRITSVIGGYDSVRRRYFACEPDHPEVPPTPPTPTSLEAEVEPELEVEEEGVKLPLRGTRSSRPIIGDISSIISSKEALRMTGGYDEELGKYVGRRSL